MPIVSDRWQGLDELFVPGREIVLADTSDDVVDLLSTWTPDQAAALGRAARARVMAGHKAADRAAELETALQEAAPAVQIPALEAATC